MTYKKKRVRVEKSRESTVNIRIDLKVQKKLKIRAAKEGLTYSALIEKLLKSY